MSGPVAPGTPAAAEPVVVVDGLVKRYGGRAVVDSVSFSIGRGELVALLGPNGAGKTTTVEILEGYRTADGGRVRVVGTDPARAGPAHRARVGLMLQGAVGVDPRLTAGEAVRLFASFVRPVADAAAIIEGVGLGPAAGTRVRRLSGGERQRLGLALALIGDPELLILDEPTAGMDPAAKRDTRALLAALRESGRTILLTTHDLADVERLADRVLILHHGRIVADGSPAALAAGDPGPGPRTAVRLSRPLDAAETAELDAWLDARGVSRLEDAGGGSFEERYLALTGDADVEASA